MNKNEHLERIIKKNKKRKLILRASILFPLILFIFGSLLFISVKLANIPEEVKEYLLYKVASEFRNNELEQLLINATGSSNQLIIFLSIYWLFILLVRIFLPIVLICMLTFSITFLWGREDRIIIAVCRLKEIAKTPATKPNMLKRFTFARILSDLELDTEIIPLRYKWYKNVKFQWFFPQAIRKRERNIIYVLSNYALALSQQYRSNGNLLPFLPSLDILESFLILSINRRKGKTQKRVVFDDTQRISEIDLLDSYAKIARPVVVEAITRRQIETERRGISNWLGAILAYKTILYVSIISLISGIIMFFGYKLFNLDAPQAFLTWFTVTFGVLSITVGIKSTNKDQE